ncbi:MAG: sugar ABC transporter permease [bacterium]
MGDATGAMAITGVGTTRRRFQAVLFLLPAIGTFLLFKYVPMFEAFRMSLYDWAIMDPPGRFVGLEQFNKAFSSSLFWDAWRNNLVLFFLTMLLGFWPPIIQAVLLNEIRRGQTLFRLGYLLPLMVPPMAGMLVWKWIYNVDYGLLNQLVGLTGISPQHWLGDPRLAKFSLALPGILGGGMGVFMYLAAIKGVPESHFEAAAIDGAGPFAKFVHVMLPLIRYMLLLQFLFALAIGFQVFDQVFVLTAGGPAGSTRVIALLIYRYAFENYEMGLASAIAICMFGVVLVLAVIQLWISKLDTE